MADANKKNDQAGLRHKIREQTVNYITAALGLVAGLAWNDAVKALIDQIYPAAKGSNIMAKFWYAGVITLVIVIISYMLLKFAEAGTKE